MITVNIPFDNTNVVEFVLHPVIGGQVAEIRGDVIEWLFTNEGTRTIGSWILDEWFEHYMGPAGIVKQVQGFSFSFNDPKDAVLFKLTWGGS